jgi:uncharacterized protein
VWRVRNLALRIARAEGADPFVTEMAALLHDLADWKFCDGDETAGPRAARRWCESLGLEADCVDHICEIVAGVSFKGADVEPPSLSLEGRVVQDADRLDALGAIGIARTFAYGGHAGFPLHDPNSAPQRHATFEDYKRSRSSSVNHFHEKLLLLKDRLHTETAKRLAASRHAFMEQFLNQFESEWRFATEPP